MTTATKKPKPIMEVAPRRHEEPWSVGGENPRESRRFRYPVYDGGDRWPWLALFENRDDARKAANRVNEYPEIKRRLMAFEAEERRLAQPSVWLLAVPGF